MAGEEHLVSGMAGRYATALFDLARENGAIDAVKADLERFDTLISENPDLARLVPARIFRRRAVEGAVRRARSRRHRRAVRALPQALTANRRLFAVHDMVRAFRQMVAANKGEATAEVTVAEEIKGEHLQALRSALKAVSGKDIDLKLKIDPAIIGGLIVKIGSRMVDNFASSTKLNAIRHAMKRAR